MGKVIAFANQKGGVGKSTLTVQAAFYLRKHRKKKVLVIDIDSQGNTTESLTQGQPYTATSSAALFEPNLEELGIFDDTPYGVDLIGSEPNSNEGYDIESRELDVIRNPAANIQALKTHTTISWLTARLLWAENSSADWSWLIMSSARSNSQAMRSEASPAWSIPSVPCSRISIPA